MMANPNPNTSKELNLIVKWSGTEYIIQDSNQEIKFVRDLKVIMEEKTGVLAERQKLLNLMYKGRQAADDISFSELNLKSGHKIMMLGSLEKDIEAMNIAPEDIPEVTNDLDDLAEEDMPLENREVYLAKVQRRIREYKIVEINPFREGKKLLVLDIDYTLFDHISPASNALELQRPFLHEFLTSCYKYYDIVIWSATSMVWIDTKMKLLGVTNNPNYKIAFHMDYYAMIYVCVNGENKGVKKVKPLGVIWGKYPQFSAKNTIMLDDVRRNFIMNPQSGLRIRPYRQAHMNRGTDRELKRLSRYLRRISKLDDFTTLEHKRWESFKKNNKAASVNPSNQLSDSGSDDEIQVETQNQ